MSNTLHKIIDWLNKRKALNLLLVVLYFVFILFMHHPLVLISVFIEHNLTIETYNLVVEAVFLLSLATMLYFISKEFLKNKERRNFKLFYLLTTLSLIIIHSRFMFDSNIEVIHSFEFTLLAFLIFPLTQRFGAAIFFTLPFMLFDEWYQYIILYPQWNDYFDLNDILMDTYGCGFAMVVLIILGVKREKQTTPIWKRPEFISMIIGAFVVLLLVKTCVIVPYFNDSCHNTWLVMNERNIPEPFWRQHPTHHIMFHVMKPLEGFIAIVMLHLFYFGLDGWLK